MKTVIRLRNQDREPLPEGFSGPDVRYTKALVAAFLEEHTQAGDVVLDPFAGFGTTLVVAEAIGREGWGVELDPARAAFAQSQMRHPERLIVGDTRRLAEYRIPQIDLSMTSPPYMHATDSENPLNGRAGAYAKYLQELGLIYQQIGGRMRPGGHAVIEVSNLKRDERVTTLAWDIAREVGKALAFQGEVIAAWDDGYGYGYDHSYCLIFQKPL